MIKHPLCNQMIDIITADTSPRPDGAPPTYDDAMKFVNDAFEHTEDTDVCVEMVLTSRYFLTTHCRRRRSRRRATRPR